MRQQTKGGQTADLESNKSFVLAASDTVDIAVVGAKIHCNNTGNYNLQLEGDDAPQIFFLVAGVIYPFRIKRLWATDTDFPAGLTGITNVGVKGAE